MEISDINRAIEICRRERQRLYAAHRLNGPRQARSTGDLDHVLMVLRQARDALLVQPGLSSSTPLPPG